MAQGGRYLSAQLAVNPPPPPTHCKMASMILECPKGSHMDVSGSKSTPQYRKYISCAPTIKGFVVPLMWKMFPFGRLSPPYPSRVTPLTKGFYSDVQLNCTTLWYGGSGTRLTQKVPKCPHSPYTQTEKTFPLGCLSATAVYISIIDLVHSGIFPSMF